MKKAENKTDTLREKKEDGRVEKNGRAVTFGQGNRGLLGVDGVEDALVSDLGLRDEADLGAQVGDPFPGHRESACHSSVMTREILISDEQVTTIR